MESQERGNDCGDGRAWRGLPGLRHACGRARIHNHWLRRGMGLAAGHSATEGPAEAGVGECTLGNDSHEHCMTHRHTRARVNDRFVVVTIVRGDAPCRIVDARPCGAAGKRHADVHELAGSERLHRLRKTCVNTASSRTSMVTVLHPNTTREEQDTKPHTTQVAEHAQPIAHGAQRSTTDMLTYGHSRSGALQPQGSATVIVAEGSLHTSSLG